MRRVAASSAQSVLVGFAFKERDMSIMTWKFYAGEEAKPGLAFDPLRVINYPSTREMQEIIADMADFLHDHFKARRRWSRDSGWRFKFGPFSIKAN